MALISIIIPVYNTSMYLKQCVDSVINQDFAQYEIILVDDGSTDSSGTICDEYSLNHDFIKVIHKENGGLSDARNTGLANALGEHILFIDSDDYISENSLSSLYDTMNEESDVDVIFLDAVKAFSDGTALPLGDNYIKDKILYKTHKEVLDHLASLPKFPGSACTKLIRRKLIAENNLYFVKNQLNEDIDWTIRLFLAAETFNYCPGYCYFYRQKRQGSITNKSSSKSLESLLGIIKKWSVGIHEHSTNDFTKYINSFLAYEYIMAFPMYHDLKKEAGQRYKHEIESYSWLLNTSKNKKVRVVKILYRILGLDASSAILSRYLELR